MAPKVKPGRKVFSCYLSAEDVATIERHIKENVARNKQEAKERGTTPEPYTLKDALRMLVIMGKSKMEDNHRHADRMEAKRVLGHMWCIHTGICGGVLTAPGEEAQRAHLLRDHALTYSPLMSAADVACNFKPMDIR